MSTIVNVNQLRDDLKYKLKVVKEQRDYYWHKHLEATQLQAELERLLNL